MSNPRNNYRSTGQQTLALETTTSELERLTLINGALVTTAVVGGGTQQVDIVAQSGPPVQITPAPITHTVTDSLTISIPDTAGGVQVLAADPNRKGATIVNNGAVPIWVGLDATVSPGNVVAADGGVLIAVQGSWSAGSYTGAVRVIADTGATGLVGVHSWA